MMTSRNTNIRLLAALFDVAAFTARVASATAGDTEVPVATNEDTDKLKQELALTDPCLSHVWNLSSLKKKSRKE